MSTGALFGNNAIRGSNKNLVELKAGKMTMKGKMVFPDNRKGLLYVYQSDDSLMHFCWKDRSTGVVEDDLIIFPDDCEFKLVSQCKTGRVYLLKFKSSSRKFFFWLQDLKTEKDDENCRKINEVLNHPPTPGSQRGGVTNPEGDLQNLLNNMSQQQLMQLFGGVGQIGGLGSLLGSMNRPFAGNRSSTSSSSSAVTTRQSNSSLTPGSAPLSENTTKSNSQNNEMQPGKTTEQSTTSIPIDSNKILLSDLQNFLSGIPPPPSAQVGIVSELSASIPAAIPVSKDLEESMRVYLPPGDNLSTTLSSPQFCQALSMFWSALQSGQVAPVVQQFGVCAEAVNAAANGNIEQFISTMQTESKTEETITSEFAAPQNSSDEIMSVDQQQSTTEKSSKDGQKKKKKR